MNADMLVSPHQEQIQHSQLPQQDIFLNGVEISTESCHPDQNNCTINQGTITNEERTKLTQQTNNKQIQVHNFIINGNTHGFTLKVLGQLPLFILQYRISPSRSQEHMRSSLFGWKSRDLTVAECPVKVRSEYPGCSLSQINLSSFQVSQTSNQKVGQICLQQFQINLKLYLSRICKKENILKIIIPYPCTQKYDREVRFITCYHKNSIIDMSWVGDLWLQVFLTAQWQIHASHTS